MAEGEIGGYLPFVSSCPTTAKSGTSQRRRVFIQLESPMYVQESK